MNRHWPFWSIFVANKIQNGFRGIADQPDGVVKPHRIVFLFKVRIYTRQLKDCTEQTALSAALSAQGFLMALRMWNQVACAMVIAVLANDEGTTLKLSQTGYDAAWVYFRRVNEFGKKILQSRLRQNVSRPTFPIDYAVGTPLFFCGFYCRD